MAWSKCAPQCGQSIAAARFGCVLAGVGAGTGSAAPIFSISASTAASSFCKVSLVC